MIQFRFSRFVIATAFIFRSFVLVAQTSGGNYHILQLPKLTDVKINDPFWTPKFKVWSAITIKDVFDKFDGKYEPDRKYLIDEKAKIGRTRDAFLNFDLVAQGKRGIGQHDGPEWYDGLVYESIRGASDMLAEYPDPAMEKRIDKYIDRIAAAQAADPDGYMLTYTILKEPTHRWGFNGGLLRGQHDVYNAGMMMEAAVHYYNATGKTKLLNVAVKLSNYICSEMGPSPKKNVVPAHAGPEEALLKLYWLFKENPDLKKKMSVSVDENSYYQLVQWWIENRGNHHGLPDWDNWGYQKSEQWIKDVKYQDPKFGDHSRPSWGSYSQDNIPVFQQKTLEGHAVRATLLATGIAATALENKNARYITTSDNYWNNMAGKRMFITGGVGAIAQDEKFGPDYYLPEGAYLETCAAAGAGFFSQRMNQLKADAKYMDEFERSLYNNILSGVSLNGDHYFYENPLLGLNHKRWSWHECPCCPPMFLKIVSALPQYIYAFDSSNLYVNLFIGSEAKIHFNNGNTISISQQTKYPWNGKSLIEVNPSRKEFFSVKIRIPGWANSKENPFDLYHSKTSSSFSLKVNGKIAKINIKDGYAEIKRTWQKRDQIELVLPVEPRLVYAHDSVQALKGKVAVSAGPLVYCFEAIGDSNLMNGTLNAKDGMKMSFAPDVLKGVNLIKGRYRYSINGVTKTRNFTAIPFFAVGNRLPGAPYKVWLPFE
jgi:DUF1680 family protein